MLFLFYSTVMSVACACGAGAGEGGGKKTLARRNVVRAEVRLSRNLGVRWVFRLGVSRVWGFMGSRVVG